MQVGHLVLQQYKLLHLARAPSGDGGTCMYILYTCRCIKVQVLIFRTFKHGTIILFLITMCAIAWLWVRYDNIRMLFATDKGYIEEKIQVNATRNTSSNKPGMHACVLDEPYIVSVHAFEFPRTLLHVH